MGLNEQKSISRYCPFKETVKQDFNNKKYVQKTVYYIMVAKEQP